MRHLLLLPPTPPSDPLERAFQAFWKAYPRRPGNPRAMARIIFRAACARGEDPVALVGAAARFAEAVRRDGTQPQFIPMAKTWLSQRRFEDWAEPEQAPPQEQNVHPLQAAFPELSEAAIRAWIDPLEIVRQGEAVVLRCPSAFHRDHLRNNFHQQLQRAFKATALLYEVKS